MSVRREAKIVAAERVAALGQLANPEQHRKLSAPMIFFMALQCLDLITTLAAFSHGGIELNPIVSHMMPWTGRVAAVVASKAVLISLVWFLGRRQRVLYIGNILYTAVVTWNVAIVFALKQA